MGLRALVPGARQFGRTLLSKILLNLECELFLDDFTSNIHNRKRAVVFTFSVLLLADFGIKIFLLS